MTKSILSVLLASLVFSGISCTSSMPLSPLAVPGQTLASPVTVNLPEPKTKGDISLEETLLNRRSIRDYADSPLTLQEVSQLLWSAQGITSGAGGRTAPSAGGLYPLEICLAAGNVTGLSPGVYRYKPESHELTMLKGGDVRMELAEAALKQEAVSKGAIDIIIAAIYGRTTAKYGERGIRYVHMEAGHAAQNVYLQATALNLGTVTIGAFNDEGVRTGLGILQDEVPLYIMPVGRK